MQNQFTTLRTLTFAVNCKAMVVAEGSHPLLRPCMTLRGLYAKPIEQRCQIDFMIDTAANSLPQVRAGTIKAYAVTAKARLVAAPDIPTVDEAGLSRFYALNWQAIFMPEGTPKDIVAKLNSAVVAALADPTVRRRLADIGQQVFPSGQQTPEALGVHQKAEIEKWWPIIKAANIKAE